MVGVMCRNMNDKSKNINEYYEYKSKKTLSIL